jgi:hypothetical protein
MLFLWFCEATSVLVLQSRSSWAVLGGITALITAIAALVHAFRDNNNKDNNK